MLVQGYLCSLHDYTLCLQGVSRGVNRMPCTAKFTAGSKVLQPWVNTCHQGGTVCIWCLVHGVDTCPELVALTAMSGHSACRGFVDG